VGEWGGPSEDARKAGKDRQLPEIRDRQAGNTNGKNRPADRGETVRGRVRRSVGLPLGGAKKTKDSSEKLQKCLRLTKKGRPKKIVCIFEAYSEES